MADVIYRKYRPQTFADVTNQTHIKVTIEHQITTGRLAHAYLFSGPRGVGKTTLARLIAKAANCTGRKPEESEPCNSCDNCTDLAAGKAMDVIEIDAASNTGVDNVRENIVEAVRFSPTRGTHKIFIIDEVHMLSTSAFNALLKTLEEPPAHIIFVLATTEIHKIPETILSRCQRFDFKRIPIAEIVKRLTTIAAAEDMTVDEDVLNAIARLSEGCLRDAESLFGQVLSLGEKNISSKEASIILPVTNTALVIDVMDAASRKDTRSILDLLNQFVDQGGSVRHLHDELIDFARTMLLLALEGPVHDHYDPATMEAMRKMNGLLSVKDISRLLDALLSAKTVFVPDALPHLPLELVFVQFCDASPVVTAPVVPPKPPLPPPAPVNTPQPPPAAPKPPESPAPVASSATASAPRQNTGGPLLFTLDELASKWKRCCEALAKRNIALPLAAQDAVPTFMEGNEVTLGFPRIFHAETLNVQKNITLLEDAIEEVMQSRPRIKIIHLADTSDQAAEDLASAFGGAVVD